MLTKCKVCKAVWSHRAMLHLAVPDKARNSTTLSPPSVHRPVSQHPSLWTTPQICISSLLLFWEVLPLHKKNIPTILQKSVKCLHLRIKKVLSLQNKVIWTKTFKLCNTYHLLLSSLVHNSHKASLTLQTWSALHLCTSPPPSCHMFQRPNPHPSVLHAIMDERFGDWIKVQAANCLQKLSWLSTLSKCPELVYAVKAVDNLFQFHSCWLHVRAVKAVNSS